MTDRMGKDDTQISSLGDWADCGRKVSLAVRLMRSDLKRLVWSVSGEKAQSEVPYINA